jgi:hypothetical protein
LISLRVGHGGDAIEGVARNLRGVAAVGDAARSQKDVSMLVAQFAGIWISIFLTGGFLVLWERWRRSKPKPPPRLRD